MQAQEDDVGRGIRFDDLMRALAKSVVLSYVLGMRPLPNTREFHELAARVIWFEPPEQALADVPRFMAYAFRYATHVDMKLLRRELSDDDLREALAKAPPGIIDARSWSYWHVMLGIFPAPPLRGRVLNALAHV